MYVVMSRLDVYRFCKVDFIINFGVPPDVKTSLEQHIQSSTQSQIYAFFDKMEPMVLLKIHKYFFWANKKLKSVFFIEDKDQISEDLLIDFKSEED